MYRTLYMHVCTQTWLYTDTECSALLIMFHYYLLALKFMKEMSSSAWNKAPKLAVSIFTYRHVYTYQNPVLLLMYGMV